MLTLYFKKMKLLSPLKLQALLCISNSFKTNHVILYLAQRNAHAYFQYLVKKHTEKGRGNDKSFPAACRNRIIK